ncbi:hypothetical protein NLI96_g8539 [Meripilus lineatus]|uniref:Uncharacterized protein n=1 Tax=Meripilus lineatus TaxID=2056292 RepID=A0AAD5UXE5_9APHY|nr:hypothetical protein NLI96_g8539 [Physisporinus lineatus]
MNSLTLPELPRITMQTRNEKRPTKLISTVAPSTTLSNTGNNTSPYLRLPPLTAFLWSPAIYHRFLTLFNACNIQRDDDCVKFLPANVHGNYRRGDTVSISQRFAASEPSTPGEKRTGEMVDVPLGTQNSSVIVSTQRLRHFFNWSILRPRTDQLRRFISTPDRPRGRFRIPSFCNITDTNNQVSRASLLQTSEAWIKHMVRDHHQVVKELVGGCFFDSSDVEPVVTKVARTTVEFCWL